MIRRAWAWLIWCPCRRLPYLDHVRLDFHVRNDHR